MILRRILRLFRRTERSDDFAPPLQSTSTPELRLIHRQPGSYLLYCLKSLVFGNFIRSA
jgi:hypothetical protein